MNRSPRHRHRLRLSSALLVSSALLLAAVAAAPRISQADGAPSATEAVRQAWRRAQEAGAYRFSTELVQITHLAPTLANVGRSSRRETLHLEGEANLPEQDLTMALWKGDGSLLDRRNGVEVRIEDGRAYGRAIEGAWHEMEDPSAAFAPGSDHMAYLAGAKNVRELGIETRRIAAPDSGGEAQGRVTVARYRFDLDGPAFAEHVRGQMEAHLRSGANCPPA